MYELFALSPAGLLSLLYFLINCSVAKGNWPWLTLLSIRPHSLTSIKKYVMHPPHSHPCIYPNVPCSELSRVPCQGPPQRWAKPKFARPWFLLRKSKGGAIVPPSFLQKGIWWRITNPNLIRCLLWITADWCSLWLVCSRRCSTPFLLLRRSSLMI